MITSSYGDDDYAVANSFYQPYNGYGWHTTSQEYHAHVPSMEVMPSATTDFPRYPNVRMIFNNNKKISFYEEEAPPPELEKNKHPHKSHATQAPKKVHFAANEKSTSQAFEDKEGKMNVYGENVDAEADGFIKNKHKKFELAKWDTFKSL